MDISIDLEMGDSMGVGMSSCVGGVPDSSTDLRVGSTSGKSSGSVGSGMGSSTDKRAGDSTGGGMADSASVRADSSMHLEWAAAWTQEQAAVEHVRAISAQPVLAPLPSMAMSFRIQSP